MKCPGFSGALLHVGWLAEEAGALSIPNFGMHNGETSKKRALKNKRQSDWRQNKDGEVDAHVDAPPSTKASTREEKRREEKKNKGGAFALPDWVPSDAWQSFEESRNKKRNSLTDRARQLCLAELQRLRDDGHEPRAVIERSVQHGWATFYPLTGSGNKPVKVDA